MTHADLLYQAYREGVQTLKIPAPGPETGPPSLSPPDIFRHMADAVPYDERDVEEERDDAYHAGKEGGEAQGRDDQRDDDNETLQRLYLYHRHKPKAFMHAVLAEFGIVP